MDDLSPAFAAESLTVNIIEELRERLESTDDYTKQLGLITEMEEKYQLEEGILLSQKASRSQQQAKAANNYIIVSLRFWGTH
jgi:uncharacterized Zn finger protein